MNIHVHSWTFIANFDSEILIFQILSGEAVSNSETGDQQVQDTTEDMH